MLDRVAILIGTRPEAIKLIPVYLDLKRRGIKVEILSTGQHKQMLDQIFEFFHVTPDVLFDVMRPDQTMAGLTESLINRLQKHIDQHRYDMLIVQGDTTTAYVGALVGFYNRIPVSHIEAGLRTYNKFSPFPEEINRQMITRLADLHFAPTTLALNNLRSEGVSNAYMVGNTVIDSLYLCLDQIKNAPERYLDRFDKFSRFENVILITGHRRENFGQGFESICKAIQVLAEKYSNTLFYYPVHLNPNVRNHVRESLSGYENVWLDEPVPYDELVYAMSRCKLILTDSGGIQEEGPSLNKPILVMRDTTERPEGVDAGCAKLVGTSTDAIVQEFSILMENPEVYERMAAVSNPYGDGMASKRIGDILIDQTR